jgi:hypothetical protein
MCNNSRINPEGHPDDSNSRMCSCVNGSCGYYPREDAPQPPKRPLIPEYTFRKDEAHFEKLIEQQIGPKPETVFIYWSMQTL